MNEQKVIQVKRWIFKNNDLIWILILVSGDSWEGEFDETDVLSSKPDVDPLTKSEETITSDNLSSSTTELPLVSSSDKKKDKEFDEDWEAWA